MTNKEKIIETASLPKDNIEVSKEELKTENVIKVKLTEYHSIEYLNNLKKTTYKGKKVVFILPNGKEFK